MIDDNDPDWKPGKDEPVEPLLSNGYLAAIALTAGVIGSIAALAGWPGLMMLSAGVLGAALGKLHERSLW